MKRKLLPFYNERQTKIDMIVLHAIGFAPEEAVQVLRRYQVSSHYLIAEDGEIWQLVGEKHRAYHAGISKWRGFDDINSRSIGIEFCSSSLGQRPFSLPQQTAAVRLIGHLIKKYKICPENIVGHSDIAPQRKPDPGKAFFWQKLAEEGIGWWYNIDDAALMPINDVSRLLDIIGYDTADLAAAAYAFCRRFLPEKVRTADIEALEKKPYEQNLALLKDEKFLKVLKATAYKYRNESKTPCKI